STREAAVPEGGALPWKVLRSSRPWGQRGLGVAFRQAVALSCMYLAGKTFKRLQDPRTRRCLGNCGVGAPSTPRATRQWPRGQNRPHSKPRPSGSALLLRVKCVGPRRISLLMYFIPFLCHPKTQRFPEQLTPPCYGPNLDGAPAPPLE
uniref:Uncharacterized protein n=1 Tax=Varanus komodoensis TaxID=61221 RepID=A0A8D2IT63_VARKO